MSRIVPALIAVVAIAVLTVVEGRMSDRWGDNRLCAYSASLMDQVPKQIGGWIGTDNEVGEIERKGSGAKGYVSRTYKNASTDEQVGIWFIVGHARDTYRHTPDACYVGSGFAMEQEPTRHELDLGEGKSAAFWTSVFSREVGPGAIEKQRVFWTWFRPEAGSGEPVVWKVPKGMSGTQMRYEFAAAPALFKLYFTSGGPGADLPPGESVNMKFAKEFLAVVDPILANANGEVPSDFVAKE